MTLLPRTIIAVAAVALGSLPFGSLPALAQVSIEPPTPVQNGGGGGGGGVFVAPPIATPPQTPPAVVPATAPATQNAEAILQELLQHRGGTEGPVLPSAVSPKPGADGLLREGQSIENRTGRLKKQDDGAMSFVFDNKAGEQTYPPMGVVPSQRLAVMEDASEFGVQPVSFSIIAQVTQYRGKNYLYIQRPTPGLPEPAAISPATAPATAPASTGEAQQLVEPVAPRARAPISLGQGATVWGRTGRLIRDPKSGGELIAFDSDGQQMTDPPMGVLPCNYLAVMEDASDRGMKPVKFRVSGEVTLYRGKNYLYLKSVQIIKDLHQGIGAGVSAIVPAASAPAK